MTPFTRKALPLIRRAYTVANGRGYSRVAIMQTRGRCSGAGTPIAIKFCRTSPPVVVTLGSLQAPCIGPPKLSPITHCHTKFCRHISASALVGRPPGFLFGSHVAPTLMDLLSVPAAIPSVSGPTSKLKLDSSFTIQTAALYAVTMFPGPPPLAFLLLMCVSFCHRNCTIPHKCNASDGSTQFRGVLPRIFFTPSRASHYLASYYPSSFRIYCFFPILFPFLPF